MFVLNILVIVTSLAGCCILSLTRFPGAELLGISPNWLLIWLIAWSVRRSIWQAIAAGICVGWVYDALTIANPSHVLSFIAVGMITASLDKDKYLAENFVSMAILVFFMTIIAETIIGIQYFWLQLIPMSELWNNYLRIVASSVVITSLWTPLIFIPLNKWWKKILV